MEEFRARCKDGRLSIQDGLRRVNRRQLLWPMPAFLTRRSEGNTDMCSSRLGATPYLDSAESCSGSLAFDDTRHTMFARSSAIKSAPERSTASPTGLPRALLFASRKPVTTSCAWPLGRPPLNGTKTTL